MKTLSILLIFSLIFLAGCVQSRHSVKLVNQEGKPLSGREICVNYVRIYPMGRPKSDSKIYETDSNGFANLKIEDPEAAVLTIAGKGLISFGEISEHQGVARDIFETGKGKVKTGMRILLK